jgi:hypothetical protein
MTVKLNMPVSEILKIDMYKPKLINGMKALLSSFKYQTGKSQVKITEAKFLTLRRQQPDTNFGYGFNFFEPTVDDYMASAGGQKFFEQTDMRGDIVILGLDQTSGIPNPYTRYEIIIYSVWFTVGRVAI